MEINSLFSSVTNSIWPAPVEGPKAGGHVIEIKSVKQFEEELKNSSVPVVVDFFATWCGPCKKVAPVFAALAKEHQGQVKCLKVDVDLLSELTKKYKISMMPTFLVFENGEVVEKLVGSNPDNLKALVEKYAGQ